MARHSLTVPDPTTNHPVLRLSALLAAAHDDVRLSPDILHRQAIEIGAALMAATGGKSKLTVSARFTRLSRYVRRRACRVVLEAKLLVLGRTPPRFVRNRAADVLVSPRCGKCDSGVGPGAAARRALRHDRQRAEHVGLLSHVAYHQASLKLVAHVCSLLGM